jgi:hypothetical protein
MQQGKCQDEIQPSCPTGSTLNARLGKCCNNTPPPKV